MGTVHSNTGALSVIAGHAARYGDTDYGFAVYQAMVDLYEYDPDLVASRSMSEIERIAIASGMGEKYGIASGSATGGCGTPRV